MNNFTVDSESSLRLIIFLGIFVFLALLELVSPRRKLRYSKWQRWLNNLALSTFNTILVTLLVPIAGVGAALLAQEQRWGLFNILQMPAWLSFLGFILLFDLAIYGQHRLFHLVPLLWRLHRVHHTDLDYDLTTGSRFHPGSILISAGIKIGLVIVLGASVAAILFAEVILNATSMFNHSNIKLPPALDAFLRRLIVTPDMHRVHHSVDEGEHNHNFGFNFSWWDRLFGSYLEQPRATHEDMAIGIEGMQDEKSIQFFRLLIQPVENPKSD